MTTTYGFVVETLSYYDGCGDDPDIIDTSEFETLKDAADFAVSCDEPWRIALRRDTGNCDEGLTDRYYAYPDASGQLPEYMESATGFNDGPRVPARFQCMIFPTREQSA